MYVYNYTEGSYMCINKDWKEGDKGKEKGNSAQSICH